MEARDGVQFLAQLLSSAQYAMNMEDLEEAIALAGCCSPSATIDRASRYYRLAHPSAGQMEALHFGKGCRWLAMVRRDSGQEAFDAECAELWSTTCPLCGKPMSEHVKCAWCRRIWCWPVPGICNCGGYPRGYGD